MNIWTGRILPNEMTCSCGDTMLPMKTTRIFKVYYIKYKCPTCKTSKYFDRETGEESITTNPADDWLDEHTNYLRRMNETIQHNDTLS